MNYIKALIEHLEADTDVQQHLDGVIDFLKVEQELKGTLSIVFNEGDGNPDDGQHQGSARDEFLVFIHVTVEHDKTWNGRVVDRMLRKKLNGRQSLGTGPIPTRAGQIQFINSLGASYDHNLDRTVRSSVYRFLEDEDC